jgi:hypothetical protein
VAAALLAAPVWAGVGRPDVATIIRRSQQAYEANWQAAPAYDYFEQDRIARGGTKTFHVLMIAGSPYRMLVAVNGEPLPPDQRAEEQRKLEEAVAQRHAESPQQRTERIAEYEKDRRRDHRLLEQFVYAFNFRLLGEQTLDGHQVYVVEASPKPGYNPPNRDTEVLTGMRGKLWIDTRTFQWVKAEGWVVRPVWIEGFLARVQPGTRFEVEYAPVSEGIWQLTHFEMRARAKVLFLFSVWNQDIESYFGYHKAGEMQLE